MNLDDTIAKVERLELRPNEVLVIHAAGILSKEQCETIVGTFERYFPSNKVIILMDGLELSTIDPVKE